MLIENKYEIGDMVYLITDKEQLSRIVFGLTVYATGECLYKLACGTQISEHYSFELSLEENTELKLK
jgi:hypothetical protein